MGGNNWSWISKMVNKNRRLKSVQYLRSHSGLTASFIHHHMLSCLSPFIFDKKNGVSKAKNKKKKNKKKKPIIGNLLSGFQLTFYRFLQSCFVAFDVFSDLKSEPGFLVLFFHLLLVSIWSLGWFWYPVKGGFLLGLSNLYFFIFY